MSRTATVLLAACWLLLAAAVGGLILIGQAGVVGLFLAWCGGVASTLLVQTGVYRAGWPDRRNPAHPYRWRGRRWVRVGPYVLGDLAAWDRSGCP